MAISDRRYKMKYGFIGCGNMGSALGNALSLTTKDILFCDRDENKAKTLAQKLGCRHGSAKDAANCCEAVFLAIKPQTLDGALEEIKDILITNKPVIITMLAGVEISTLQAKLSDEIPIIRIMPNTPVRIGKGEILYCRNSNVTDFALSAFLGDMKFAGSFDLIDEALMNVGCAVSGCGPAYMYMVADAVAKGAEKLGIDYELSLRLAARTMLGSAQMLLETGERADKLKTDVCSPGGSTIEGVKVLENGEVYNLFADAVEAAYKRNEELGKQ